MDKIKAGVYYATYGHWTLSLLNAGYDVVWHVQPDIKEPRWKDKTADLILQANFPKVFTNIGKEVNIICGSPPCIGFSNANPKSNPDHWANKNFIACFKKIKELQPDYFLVEMVTPIFTKGKKILAKAMSEVKDYKIYYKIFEVSDYGFPCIRKRVYFFGSYLDYGENPLDLLFKRKSIGCGEILEPFKEKWNNYKPDGFKLLSKYRKKGGLVKGPYSIMEKSNRKLKINEPCFTITGMSYTTMYHYDKERFLSLEEIAALMGFPLDYKFRVGCRKKGISQVCQIIASGVDIRFTIYLLKFLRENKYIA